MKDYYVFGNVAFRSLTFTIETVCSGQILKRNSLDTNNLYYVRFLDGRVISLSEEAIKKCRKLTEEEKIQLL